MIPGEQIQFVQDRYEYLHLSPEQARSIYLFEQEKSNYTLSVWEEWDLDLATFRDILNDKQYTMYKDVVKDLVHNYEHELKKQDEAQSNELAYWEEVLDYYESRFLAVFFKDPALMVFTNFFDERPKIEYLRAEYKRYLRNAKNRMVSEHIRNNRTFQPKALKALLVKHRLDHIWPDYFAFLAHADEGTQAMIQYMIKKFRIPPETEQKIKQLLHESEEMRSKLRHKHSRDLGGWQVSVTTTDDELREYYLMTLLLLDKNKYA